MNRKIFAGFIFILLIILLIRLYLFFYHQKTYAEGEAIDIETTVLSDVKVSGNSQRFTLHPPNSSEAIFVSMHRFPAFSYGDTIRISGTITKKVIPSKKPVLAMYFPTIKRIKKASFLDPVIHTRMQIIKVFESALPTDSSALLLGIVFGIKRPMSESLQQAFQTTGLLHVIAASGMNITMVGGFLSGIFSYVFRRRQALVLTLIGIFYYALLSGFEASIVRAAIMGGIAYSAKILGRQSLSWYSLLITGVTMLFITPQLLFDVGFQLSFLATAGLIFIPPLFEFNARIKTIIAKSFIGEDFITTLSAQIVTMPLLLLYFGTISFTSLVVNTIVLWTVPILMIIGGICALIGLLVEPLAQIILLTSYPLLLYMQTIPKLFAMFGMGTFKSIPPVFVVGYYFFLAAFLSFEYSRHKI